MGIERLNLMACIKEPVAKADPRSDSKAELVEAAIWAAIEGLAKLS